ncbi:hypothetical protein ACJJIU_10290 [Microbulbifer sp. CnH-101-E]|uniref:hypothetical protein n=1 Tax=unclassified Microbulbifer TaxID=2619833 RepID=UPI0040398FA7
MVNHDCQTPNGEQKFIESLYECHSETKNLKTDFPNLQLIQFSDSVVFALPYSTDNYIALIKIISDYQYNLLSKGILCRGGLSYGKHFSTEDFLFSQGMIDAYRLESEVAITPRVVISKELLDLVGPNFDSCEIELPTCLENDGLTFIDFLTNRQPEESWTHIEKAIPENLSNNPSVRNKQIWLIDFYNHINPTHKRTIIEKFN